MTIECNYKSMNVRVLWSLIIGLTAGLAISADQWFVDWEYGPWPRSALGGVLDGWPIRIIMFLTGFILWFGMSSWPRQTKRVTRAFMVLIQIIVGLLLIWWLVRRG